jgi:hypothetical protein
MFDLSLGVIIGGVEESNDSTPVIDETKNWFSM